MVDTGESVGLAEWIIDDTCLLGLFVQITHALPPFVHDRGESITCGSLR